MNNILNGTVPSSPPNRDMENARQLKLLKESVNSMLRESHIPYTELKLSYPARDHCEDDNKQCQLHDIFQIDGPPDIIALIRALLKKVEHYMLAEKSRRDELESIVSERTKQLEEEKVKAQAAARKKSEFIASMSHELRSPLNSIIGFAERIPPRIERIGDNLNGLVSYIDSPAPENGNNGKNGVMEIIDNIRVKEINTIKEFCGYIRNSGSHLLDLINDILDMSKIEADKMVLFLEAIDFRPHVESVTASFRNVVEEKNLDLSCDVQEVSPFIYVDKVRFDQILFNLVGNAVKFSESGGAVKICARELAGEGAVEFCVLDNGVGISDEFREYLFKSFECSDKSGVKTGVGLGLAIAKKLVELMGGRIWFESVPGQGSSFYFTVPADKVCKVR
ncbi:MAG: sensor histidine kinase [Nitrospinota bacterium]